jgi:hypothetical protein
MSNDGGLKYWVVTGVAIVVCLVVIFWKPSTEYTAAIYREPNYVQEPYFQPENANCGSVWSAATGDLENIPAPQYPPPPSESAAQYLGLLTTYQSSLNEHSACSPKRQNFELILGVSIFVGITSQVLRRRKRSENEHGATIGSLT